MDGDAEREEAIVTEEGGDDSGENTTEAINADIAAKPKQKTDDEPNDLTDPIIAPTNNTPRVVHLYPSKPAILNHEEIGKMWADVMQTARSFKPPINASAKYDGRDLKSSDGLQVDQWLSSHMGLSSVDAVAASHRLYAQGYDSVKEMAKRSHLEALSQRKELVLYGIKAAHATCIAEYMSHLLKRKNALRVDDENDCVF